MFGSPIPGKRLTIYLPDRDQAGELIEDIELWVREASYLLVTIAGGCTRLPAAKGIWYNDKAGVFIEEVTHLIYSYCDPVELSKHMNLLQDFVSRFLVVAKQQTVAIEVGDRMYFVGHTPEKRPSPNGEARVAYMNGS